jgi:A/G-specific adenine glycosylase
VKLTKQEITKFNQAVLGHYDQNARHELPWRQAEPSGDFDPYKIWVSELMLQQTQVNRVIPKYVQFLQQFPTTGALAAAELGEVLTAWQGLGYNRRAKYLWQAAQAVVTDYAGQVPRKLQQLTMLPGIGHNTAGAILAYSFNVPVLFIETNIRSVYFHHFFTDRSAITDKEVMNLLAQTLNSANPREYYWALMDYGTYLKQQGLGAVSQGKHYAKQSKFEGSLRQIRGRIVTLLAQQRMTPAALVDELADDRVQTVLTSLEKEGLIRLNDGTYRLA